jgi:rod shape-determining protein MreB and related proteins
MGNAIRGLSKDLAIDLGTCNTLVVMEGQGVVVDEPSVVAVQRGHGGMLGSVLAVGKEASEMVGRTPSNIVAVRPLRGGVISDFRMCEEMLRHFINMANDKGGFFKPRILACVPHGVTEVEKRAVYESARAAGGREVYLLSEPLAAALGAGLPIMEPTGSMIIDIGGGTTEIAVISMGAIVRATSLKVAGDQMDTAIVAYLKEEHGLVIGEKTAEHIKREVGCAIPHDTPITATIKGRDSNSGVPKQIAITSVEIGQALAGTIRQILQSIQRTLAATPPELSGDLHTRGIVICGGGSLLYGIDTLISETTKVDCVRDSEPLTCVARGAGLALEDPFLLNRVALA